MKYNLDAEIKFVHSDGTNQVFVTAQNSLTGDQMYSFNNWRDCYAGSKSTVKNIITDIFNKARVTKSTFDNKSLAPLNETSRKF